MSEDIAQRFAAMERRLDVLTVALTHSADYTPADYTGLLSPPGLTSVTRRLLY